MSPLHLSHSPARVLVRARASTLDKGAAAARRSLQVLRARTAATTDPVAEVRQAVRRAWTGGAARGISELHAAASRVRATVAQRGARMLVAGGTVAILLASCGDPPGTRAAGTPTPPPTPATPSPTAAARGPLVAVLDRPFGTAANTLRLVRPDGTEVARTTLSEAVEAVAMAGRRVLIAGDGAIRALDEDGAITDVERLAPASPTDLLRGIVAAPDGATWVWTVLHRDEDGTLHSRVYLGALGAEPRLLADRAAPDHALSPISWSGGSPIMSDDLVGIGGYIIFRHSFGVAERLDPTSGALTPVAPESCALSDVAPDGRVSCVLDGREGPHGNGPVTLRVLSPGGPSHDLALPATVAQAGAALFSPDGDHLTLASSPAQGSDAEVIVTELLDTATWTRRSLGTGLVPAAWLDSSRVVAIRDPGTAGGDAGVYVVDIDGTSTRLAAATTVIGLVRAA